MRPSLLRLSQLSLVVTIVVATIAARGHDQRADNGLARTPQDSLGIQGTIVQASPSELEVWVKPLADRSRAVLLFNRASVSSNITAEWGRVGLGTKKARVRNLWTHTDSASVENRYAATVPSHGVVMLRVWPLSN